MELEHAPRGFPYSSAKTLLSRRSGEMDFHDVFGGPPRRFSMQEVRGRYVSGETVIEEDEEEEDRVSMPVFGEETTPRRRHPGGNFFDDIFGGNESSYVSPRNRDHDRNTPKSMSCSPSKPRSEQFGTSPTAQFSPPAKSNKIELPAFLPSNHGSYKLDISTNVLISPRTPLSRFSSQVIQDEIRPEARLHRQSTLPREACFKIEDLRNTLTSNEKETSPNSKKERRSLDSSSTQFYRSLYKWASGRGIQMMNLGRNSSKSKDGRNGKCASFNGRVENKLSIFRNGGLFVNTEPDEHLTMEGYKKDSLSTEERERNSVQEVILEADADDISVEVQPSTKSERTTSQAKSNIKDRILREVQQKDESPTSEIMPTLRSLLIAEAEIKGTEEIKATTPRTDEAGPSKSLNLEEETSINVDSETTFASQGSPGKPVAKVKVKEFVRIFNQEADMRTKTDDYAQNNSCKWNDKKLGDSFHAEKVDENLKDNPERQPTKIQKIPATESKHLAPNHDMASSSDSFPGYSTTSTEDSEKSMKDYFMVEHSSNDIGEVTRRNEDLEHIKSIDTKIQQWSMDKSGNIRSLLSTLQYVLWPGSGWSPIPLVELIEATSVKRAYQKALLRLHPDKLQQNSTASHHKYTAEKIFDILQEAWDHFNDLAPL